MKNKILKLFVVSLLVVLSTVSMVSASTASNLAGRVLLQVEAHGEAWYVNPVNLKRYFLGRAADAAKIIRALGLGVSNKDLTAWKGYAPARLAGRILLQVEAHGEAYYVYPPTLKLIYLGTPETAFAIWHTYSLGATNKTIAQITPEFNLSATVSGSVPSSQAGRTVFNWNYKGKAYNLSLALEQKVYNDYAQSTKVYKYFGDLPANWHEDYYAMFLKAKSGDNTIKDLVGQLKYIASKEGMSDDELVNLTMAFVQTIPYDHGKDLDAGKPNYPYETLFTRLGVCSDKTFLAVMILRELGYGAAVIDLPDVNHAAVGIECPMEYSVFGSGYCYAETTNFFPIGVVPQNFGANGVVLNQGGEALKGQFDNVFRTSQLGKPEILQKTHGKIYTGARVTHDLVNRLIALEKDLLAGKGNLEQLKVKMAEELAKLNDLKSRMNEAKARGDIDGYNALVAPYNVQVSNYNNAYASYKLQSDIYNGKVNLYNELIVEFYPGN